MPYMRKVICKDQISVCYGDSKALLDNWGVLMKNIRPNSDMKEEGRIMKNL